MNKREEAEKIIKNHVIWSMGAGLIPVPLIDLTAVTAIQIDMIRQLAKLYDADYSKSSGKAFISALTGSTFAKVGSSLVKLIPGIGTYLGEMSMAVLSGASTYGVGQAAISVLEVSNNLFNIDFKWAKQKYEKAFEQGKKIVTDIEEEKPDETTDIFQKMEKLHQLKEQGIISQEEYDAKKKEFFKKL